MSIKHVIIHVVKRDKDGENLSRQLRKTENSTAGMAEKLTEGLIGLFSTANLNIGEFGVDGDSSLEPAFEQLLKRYYQLVPNPSDEEKSKKILKCSDFVIMTQELAKHYRSILVNDNLHSVKGGYLVFYEYEVRNEQWFGIAVLNKTEGVDVSDNLDVIAREMLDLKKLHLGAAINITQWNAGFSSRYIRFKAGLAAEVRDYFERFIGCQRDKEAARQETTELKKAIRGFGASEYNFDEKKISEKLSTAHAYIKEQMRDGRPVLFEHVANHVFPDKTKEFKEYVSKNYTISDELAIDNGALRTYEKISGRGNGISISFDREVYGRTVKYDNGILKISDIPEKLREALKEEDAFRRKNESNSKDKK